MKNIVLYGALGQNFGRHHKLDVQTPAEAVRALAAVIPGFRKFLEQHQHGWFKVWVGAERSDEQRFIQPCSDRETIRIAPYVQGAGGKGGLLAGALMLAAVVFAPELLPAFLATTTAGVTTLTTLGSMMGSMGLSMVLSGIAGMLAPSPKTPQQTTPSYGFSGVVNNIQQGNPVPLCYGELIVGSQVISAGMNTMQMGADVPLYPVTTIGMASNSTTTLRMSGRSDKEGPVYWLLQPFMDPPPTIDQVLAGNSLSVFANTTFYIDITGLVMGTSYTFYMVAKDTNNHCQVKVTAVGVQTVNDQGGGYGV